MENDHISQLLDVSSQHTCLGASVHDMPSISRSLAPSPRSLACSIRYNVHTYSLNWDAQTVRLSTTQGRMSMSFTVPHFSERYRGCRVATADLVYRNGTWWLHVVVSVPEPVVERQNEVIGVDLGLSRPAVTSNRQFLGKRHWKEVERRRFRLRRKLQSKGTKSAKRHLKKVSGRSL